MLDALGGGSADVVDPMMRKTQAMRQRAQERRERLHNPKLRIGIDKNFLDRQVAEKRETQRQEAMEEAAYNQYEVKMRDLVWAREMAEMEEEAMLKEELKEEWSEAAAERLAKMAEAKADRQLGTEPDLCGTASAQRLEGEDPEYEDREAAHDAQVQAWLAQQVEEKRARGSEEKAEEARYARYEAFVATQRQELAQEEDRRREARLKELTEENLAEARAVKARSAARAVDLAALDEANLRRRLADPALCESTALGRSVVSTYRYRPDHFKGFSKERTKVILGQNQTLVDQKRDLAAIETAHDDAYLASQTEILHLAADEEMAIREMGRHAALAYQKKLANQRDIDRQRREKAKADRFGAIGPGYMDGFGTSDR